MDNNSSRVSEKSKKSVQATLAFGEFKRLPESSSENALKEKSKNALEKGLTKDGSAMVEEGTDQPVKRLFSLVEYERAMKNAMVTSVEETIDDSSDRLCAFREFRRLSEVLISSVGEKNKSGVFGLTRDGCETGQLVERTLAFGEYGKAVENSMPTSVQDKTGDSSDKPLAYEEYGRSQDDLVIPKNMKSGNEVENLKKQLAEATAEIESLKRLVRTTKEKAASKVESCNDRIKEYFQEKERLTKELDQRNRSYDLLLELLERFRDDDKKKYNKLAFDYDLLHARNNVELAELLEKKNEAEKQHSIQMEKVVQLLQSIKTEISRQFDQNVDNFEEHPIDDDRIRDFMREHEQMITRTLSNSSSRRNPNVPAIAGNISNLVIERENILLREMSNDGGNLRFVLRKIQDFEKDLWEKKRNMRLQNYIEAAKIDFVAMIGEIESNLKILMLLFPHLSGIKELWEEVNNFDKNKFLEVVRQEICKTVANEKYMPIPYKPPMVEEFNQKYQFWIGDLKFKNYQRKMKEKEEQQRKQNGQVQGTSQQ